MKSYNQYIKTNGTTDLNIYMALCIVDEYRKAKKQGVNLSVSVETTNGKITRVNYKRD